MPILDAYGHVALPRLMSAELFLQVMDENDVSSALISTAETCPDVGEIARGAASAPQRLRGVGLPMGETAAERIDHIKAQMDAGFAGIRIGEGLITEHPELLQAIGERGGVPFVIGREGLVRIADHLLDFLAHYPTAIVAGVHFAGPMDPAVFARERAMARLFDHDRFVVICSRHSAMDQDLLHKWAGELVQRIGWSRLLFGSEYPVAQWRNESYRQTLEWMDRYKPTDQERNAYRHDNAHRMLWDRPVKPARPLEPEHIRMDLRTEAEVWLFPDCTLDLPEPVHQKLLQRYLAIPASQRPAYARFVANLIEEHLS